MDRSSGSIHGQTHPSDKIVSIRIIDTGRHDIVIAPRSIAPIPASIGPCQGHYGAWLAAVNHSLKMLTWMDVHIGVCPASVARPCRLIVIAFGLPARRIRRPRSDRGCPGARRIGRAREVADSGHGLLDLARCPGMAAIARAGPHYTGIVPTSPVRGWGSGAMDDRSGTDGARPRLGVLLAVIVSTAAITHAREEKITIAGLRQPVEIVRDRWGIAHIYAQSEHDLFLAQGYNAASDRLFQLELWRRRATGTMAEIQGPRALAADIGSRLLAFRGDMGAELNHYHPRGAEIVGAFVRGINAYIERTEREPARLPVEFRILGIKPGRWTPEIVVSRHNGLYRNVTQELDYARLVHLLGAAPARELLSLHPGHPTLEPDQSLDLSILSDALIETYRASRAPVRFRPEDVGPESRAKAAGVDREGPAIAAAESDPDAQGSNNWAIAGARTFSGGAVMANDPHRALLLPSLRYWVHLIAPGWNVIGAGEPALPGVSVGHNEHGAWGFTIFPIDQEDLYVYETDPADPSRYRYRGGWETMRTIRETIAVKGAAPAAVDLKFTRHGPVVAEDRAHHRAYAIRAAWLEQGGRLTWRASGWIRSRAGPSSARRAGSSISRPRTWSGPIATVTSAGRRWGWPLVARGGPGSCRCRATGVTSGPGSCRCSTCRTWSTRRGAGSPRPTRTTSPRAIPSRSATSGPSRSGSRGSRRCSARPVG